MSNGDVQEMKSMDPAFWKNKKVFVTGHTGFKGAWLCLWLHAWGASVTGYSLKPPTEPNVFELCRLDEWVDSHIADVRDLEKLSAALSAAAPDIVIHMAAQPLVRTSYAAPAETYGVNLMGTVHVLEAVRRAVQQGVPIRAVVNVTTDKCYENREWVWGYRETDPLGGSDPYSGSKACSELITATYRESFFSPGSSHPVAVGTARAGNVIGGGDWAADRLVPDAIKALSQGDPVAVRYPHAIRPWQHVLAPLHGYLLLAQRLAEHGASYAEAWNFGPSEADMVPVEQLVSRLCRLWGPGASYRTEPGVHPREAGYLMLDCSKARRTLGWAPRWNLDESLTRIVEWAKAYERQEPMRDVCLRQIRDYTG
ncbi:CDP-glucose 4,6-dehydratase [Paenibacillus hodogayensis]|uniref:CDP-glucose 4,6-dehydratase n=1 Tax=Paenibacillus hodogayensis TaxID=279208 RepID=A0ABV5W2G1_9BACL